MTDHFYLTLPSDASAEHFPNNTVARYVTKLPQPVCLDGDYEVGLSELVYPHNWHNVDNGDRRYWVGALDIATGKIRKAHVKSGYYPNAGEFASSLTHQTTRTFADIPDISMKITFDERFRIQIQNSNDRAIILSSELWKFLASVWNRGLHLMYVYCDVASHSIVGDVKVPILRVCNATGEHGRVVHETYARPHYVPVRRREFDAVEIAINNELGDSMPFEFGKVIARLHFRRRQ